MEHQIELKKVFGEVFLTIDVAPDNTFINAQWSGVQSEETVMEGCEKLLELAQTYKCPGLLNSNKKVIGSWNMAVNWAANEWAPRMRAAGIKYFAQVLPSTILAATSIESFLQEVTGEFEIRNFDNDVNAENWLRSV